MESASPYSTAASEQGPVPRWARRLLATAAALELIDGASNLPVLFGGPADIPGPGLGGLVIKAQIALQPVLALAALVFAAGGRIRAALFAMAGINTMRWLGYLPSVALHGLDLGGDGAGGFITVLQIVLAPLIAAAVAWFAWTGQRLKFAVLLAALPTAFSVLFAFLFAFGVALYGF
jgi:hypothetical protein